MQAGPGDGVGWALGSACLSAGATLGAPRCSQEPLQPLTCAGRLGANGPLGTRFQTLLTASWGSGGTGLCIARWTWPWTPAVWSGSSGPVGGATRAPMRLRGAPGQNPRPCHSSGLLFPSPEPLKPLQKAHSAPLPHALQMLWCSVGRTDPEALWEATAKRASAQPWCSGHLPAWRPEAPGGDGGAAGDTRSANTSGPRARLLR